MKQWISISLALVLCLGIAACANKTATTTPAPPPVGSINSFDAATNTTLETVHAFVASVVSDNNSGKITLTTAQKAALNQIVSDLNIADSIYQAWHAAGGTGPTTTVQAAVTKVQTDQTALNSALGGK